MDANGNEMRFNFTNTLNFSRKKESPLQLTIQEFGQNGFEVDEFGIRKYANRAYKCDLCGWAYSDKYAKKAKLHAANCPAVWIFEDWKPQKLEALKSVQS